MTASAPSDSLALARRLVALARERRAEDPVVLDVRGLVDYTDFFVLLTGRSLRQNQAIAEHLVRSLKADGRYALSKAGVETGSWVCLDFADAVIHVFDPETRARYDLELLWADAPRMSPDGDAEAEAAAKPKPKRRRVVRKAAVPDADVENAPDEARPPLDEPEPPEPRAAKKAARPRSKAAPKAKPKAAAKKPAPKRKRSPS